MLLKISLFLVWYVVGLVAALAIPLTGLDAAQDDEDKWMRFLKALPYYALWGPFACLQQT